MIEPSGKRSAVRVALLPKGSVKLESVSAERFVGVISKEMQPKPRSGDAKAARQAFTNG